MTGYAASTLNLRLYGLGSISTGGCLDTEHFIHAFSFISSIVHILALVFQFSYIHRIDKNVSQLEFDNLPNLYSDI